MKNNKAYWCLLYIAGRRQAPPCFPVPALFWMESPGRDCCYWVQSPNFSSHPRWQVLSHPPAVNLLRPAAVFAKLRCELRAYLDDGAPFVRASKGSVWHHCVYRAASLSCFHLLSSLSGRGNHRNRNRWLEWVKQIGHTSDWNFCKQHQHTDAAHIRYLLENNASQYTLYENAYRIYSQPNNTKQMNTSYSFSIDENRTRFERRIQHTARRFGGKRKPSDAWPSEQQHIRAQKTFLRDSPVAWRMSSTTSPILYCMQAYTCHGPHPLYMFVYPYVTANSTTINLRWSVLVEIEKVKSFLGFPVKFFRLVTCFGIFL